MSLPARCATFCLAGMTALTVGTFARAEDGTSMPKDFARFSGFGTLGAVHTRGNGATFIRDITQPQGASNQGLSWKTDSRFGVQANLKAAANLEAVAQIVSRYRWDNDFKPELTWGFIKYAPNDLIETRIGRIGFDALQAAESREVGYTYLWVRPPVEYYGTWTLLLPYQDGGDIAFRTPVGNGVGKLKLYTGIARQHASILQGQREWAGNMHIGPVGAIVDLSGARVTGALVDYQDTHWSLRLGHAILKFSREFPPALVDVQGLLRSAASLSIAQGNAPAADALNAFVADVAMAGKRLKFSNIAAAYEDGPLQIQAAFSHMVSETLVISGSNAGYLSAGYRLGKFTPYATFSAIRSNHSGRDDALSGIAPPAMVSLARYAISTGHETQRTYSLGLRYGLSANTTLKAQADVVRSGNCSPVSLAMVGPTTACAPPLLWPVVPVGWNGRATVLSAALDFIF